MIKSNKAKKMTKSGGRSAVALAAALALQGAAIAQSGASYQGPSVVPGAGAPSSVFPGTSSGGVNYSTNAQVTRLVVSVEKNDLPADGVSANRVSIQAYGANGQLLTGDLIATVEISGAGGGARILLDGAKTDEFGPGRRDADRVTPGVQIPLKGGQASFTLLAPVEPGDVRVRITAGAAVAQGVVSYIPELREFVAAGLLEGIIAHNKQGNAVSPVRIDDAFERELRRWVHTSSDGKNRYGVRSAFFVKGKLQNQWLDGWLLTAAFDSDKDTRNRYLSDPRADERYPVYGDSALRGAEAKSADRVYLRLDKGKNYALYGDFNTADGFSQLSGTGNVAGLKVRNLGAYSRSATGLRGHAEDKGYLVNAFAFQDSLKQVVEEYRGNGTSGPYRTKLTSGIQNTEKVEIITRDRNQTGVVIDVKALARFDDYVFEPFSGAILLKSSLPSVDANGNPISLRITYEVDQGGQEFWTSGIDGQVRIGQSGEIGGSYVRDANPLSPYTLSSVNGGVNLGENTRVTLEVARSNSTRYTAAGQSYTTPSGGVGEVKNERSGSAWRAELQHKGEKTDAAAWAMASGRDFYNPSASISEGKAEYGARAGYALSESTQLYGEASRSQNRSLAGDPKRDAQALGLRWRPTQSFTLDASLRHVSEDAGFTGGSTLSGNAATGGGFFGLGNDALNPNTGTVITSNTLNGNTVSTAGINTAKRSASTLRLGANWQPSERWTLKGELEAGSSSQRRWAAGAQYRIAERVRIYGNYEAQRGLTSSNALNPADKSNALTFGVDSTYMPGGTLFSEYRLRDSLSGAAASNRDMQLATGVRNTWNVSEGLAYTTSAEYLKVFQGNVRNALALAGGVDYSVSEQSKLSARLEWRRLYDDIATAGDQSENQYLSTVSYARKLNRDWTLLTRNYLLLNDYSDKGDHLQDRFQFGFAWRPVDNNRVNALGRYEYKIDKDLSSPTGENYSAHIWSLHGTYHPSRPWWFSGRTAFKSSTDKSLPVGQQRYTAWLLGGRMTYDFSERWDASLMASVLGSPQGAARQYAAGLELGYLLKTDLWLSAGFNWTGFKDRDLTAGEYTNRGWYIRLRFKFDENLWRSDNKSVNRALDR